MANLHYMEYAILIRGTFRRPLGEIPNSSLLAISKSLWHSKQSKH